MSDLPSSAGSRDAFRWTANYPQQMHACLDLFALTDQLNAAKIPIERDVDQLILQIAARMTKTYRAVLHLCVQGHGEQATMLNRAMFEDVIVAYWANLHPDEAVTRLKDHRTQTVHLWRDYMTSRGIELGALGDLPDLSDEERERLSGLFGQRGDQGLTGFKNYKMMKLIEANWGDAKETKLLWHMHDVHLCYANLTLHVSGMSLLTPLASADDPSVEFYPSSPSERDIAAALLGAFWACEHVAADPRTVCEGEDRQLLPRPDACLLFTEAD